MPDPLRVPGATPHTLLGYLLGLGLLRVIARQADPTVRASWTDDALELHGSLDANDVSRFLLEYWVPAPVVSPWNGGSGFFPKDNTTAFRGIEADASPRLDAFRETISMARTALVDAGLTEKPEPKLAKPALLRELRARLPDEALAWLDAAVVLVGDDAAYPPVLGSGGNDGRYDIANNYAQAVVFALAVGGTKSDREAAEETLGAALWREPGVLRKMSLAHLHRDASPVNSPRGESDALGNPWELALAVEGTLLLAAGTGRRLAADATPSLVAPFTLRSTGAGYGSAVSGENGKAELWLPTWAGRATLAEIERLFREGRVQVGRRAARSGLDAARAASELGVARGVDSFQRFSILERAGLSNLAVPAGRVEVRARPAALVLRSLDPWLGRVIGYGAGDVPGAQREAIRRLEEAAFAVAERGDPESVATLLVALGAVERVLARADERSRPAGLRPTSPKAGEWLRTLDWSSSLVRVSVGLASVADLRQRQAPRLPALRDYLHGTGIDTSGRRRYGQSTAGTVPELASTAARLAAVHERRHQDAAREGLDHLGYATGVETPLTDLESLVQGRIDQRTLGQLVDGLSLLDYGEVRTPQVAASEPTDALLGLLALAFHERRAGDGRLRPRQGWVAKIRAHRAEAVVPDVLLRLRLADLVPLAHAKDLQAEHADGRLLATALLARPRERDLRIVAARLTIDVSNKEVYA